MAPKHRGGVRAPIAILAAALFTSLARGSLIQRQDGDANRPWVSIDANGAVQTVTPTVNGGSSFTGSKTLPTLDANGAGAFLICTDETNFDGTRNPFCAPQSNQDVTPGKTILITWDTNWFENPEMILQVQGDFDGSDGAGGKEGFTSPDIVASTGFYAWKIEESHLQNGKATNVTFFFAYPNSTSGDLSDDRDPGPEIRLVPLQGSGGGGSRNVAMIVVPVILGVLALAVIAFFVHRYGRKKGMFGGGSGYGVRKSRGQRIGAAKGTNIRLAEGGRMDHT